VERTEDRTVVVAVPTLAAHERTERFEERLNRGPVEGPGLGRQITASLYAMTWARGYGQYAGAPVENVLANRHVELSTNAGIVRTQRDVFGTSDPNARGEWRARRRGPESPTCSSRPASTRVVDRGRAQRADTGVRDGPGERDGSGENDTPGDQPSEDAAFEFGEERTDERTSVPVGRAADEGRRASTTILTRSSRARIGSKHASRRRRRRLSTAGVRRRRHPLPRNSRRPATGSAST